MFIRSRIHFLELTFGAYLFFVGCYDLSFGKNHYFIFLFLQSFAFLITGVGYVGTFVPNAQWNSFGGRIISRITNQQFICFSGKREKNVNSTLPFWEISLLYCTCVFMYYSKRGRHSFCWFKICLQPKNDPS